MFFLYVFPLYDNASIILTHQKSKIYFIELIKSFIKTEIPLLKIFYAFLILPLIISILSTVFAFLKNRTIKLIMSLISLAFFPVLFLSSAINFGIYLKPAFFTHLVFISLYIISFSVFFTTGLILTFKKKTRVETLVKTIPRKDTRHIIHKAVTQKTPADYLNIILGSVILLVFIIPYQKEGEKLLFFFQIKLSISFIILLSVSAIASISLFINQYLKSKIINNYVLSCCGIIGFLSIIILMFFNERFKEIFEPIIKYQWRFIILLIPLFAVCLGIFSHINNEKNKTGITLFLIGSIPVVLLYFLPINREIPVALILELSFSEHYHLLGIIILAPLFFVCIGCFIFSQKKSLLKLSELAAKIIFWFAPIFFISFSLKRSSILKDFGVILVTLIFVILLTVYQIALKQGLLKLVERKKDKR